MAMKGRPEDIFRDSAQKECSRVAGMISTKSAEKAPKATGQYAAGFYVAEDTEGATVMNNPGPDRPRGLWEMLEFGHDVVRNGKVVGHKGPTPHIRPAIAEVKAELDR